MGLFLQFRSSYLQRLKKESATITQVIWLRLVFQLYFCTPFEWVCFCILMTKREAISGSPSFKGRG